MRHGNIREDVNNDQPGEINREANRETDGGINGEVNNVGNSQAAISKEKKTRVYLILGWVFAAFTAFISPLFALPGVIFGILANQNREGVGTAAIITNIVLAAVNIIFALILYRSIF